MFIRNAAASLTALLYMMHLVISLNVFTEFDRFDGRPCWLLLVLSTASLCVWNALVLHVMRLLDDVS